MKATVPEFELHYKLSGEDGSMVVSLWCTTGLTPLILIDDLVFTQRVANSWFSLDPSGDYLTIKCENARGVYKLLQHDPGRAVSIWRAVSG